MAAKTGKSGQPTPPAAPDAKDDVAPVPELAPETPVATRGDRHLAVDGSVPPDDGPPDEGPGLAAAAGLKRELVEIGVELVPGQLVDVESEVVVVGAFHGLPLQGTAGDVDKRLNNWLKRAFEYGMMSTRLGEVTFLPIGRIEPRPIKADYVLVVGMGDPVRFSRADLQYLYMNIVCAVKAAGLGGFSDTLANAPRFGLKLDRVVRSVFDGVADAYERLACFRPKEDPGACLPPLRVRFVEPDPEHYEVLDKTLKQIEKQTYERHSVALKVTVRRPVPPAPSPPATGSAETDDGSARDTEPETPVVRFSVTVPPSADQPASPTPVTVGGPVAPRAVARRQVFQCTAVTNSATIPVRELQVDPYFVSQLPDRLVNVRTLREQEMYGALLSSYLLPEDFLKLLDPEDMPDDRASLTLILDRSSAVFPWEMAAVSTGRAWSFLGADFRLTRQFRTLFSEPPGLAPPLNNQLEVLIIANPADGRLDLPGALQEGLAVVRALTLAQKCWGDRILTLRLTIRLGSPRGGDAQELKNRLRDSLRREVPYIKEQAVEDAAPCDPLEILALMITNHFDVVHYAGHGVFDPASGREGWVFNEDCTLSAREIVRMRKVPRLVFANACHSSKVENTSDPLPHVAVDQVSLAEAFFARGVENYIGAGWEVDDQAAREFAYRFYLQALGIKTQGGQLVPEGLAPPSTLGASLAAARLSLLGTIREKGESERAGTTWAAYQHYGEVNSKLLPFTNDDVDSVGNLELPPT